jgi:hypothetical protein
LGDPMMKMALTAAASCYFSCSLAAAEWSPSPWCDPHLIERLIKEYEPNENAYTQYVFLGDALRAMGCLAPAAKKCMWIDGVWMCPTRPQ